MSDKQQYPSDKQDKFMLRLPEGMRARIKELADANGRSMNAEIVHRLEESFSKAAVSIEELEASTRAHKKGQQILQSIGEFMEALSETSPEAMEKAREHLKEKYGENRD